MNPTTTPATLSRHVHSEQCAREDWGPYGKVVTCGIEYEDPTRRGNFQKGVQRG